MLRCGKCQGVLYSSPRQDTRRYVCLSGPDHGGCGRLTVVAAPVEDLITRAVLLRLDSPELADALSGRAAADEHTAALALALAEDRQQQEELGGLWAAKKIDTAGWLRARGDLEARIRETETRLARLTRSDALAGLVGNGEQLRTSWDGLKPDPAGRDRPRRARPRRDRSRRPGRADPGPGPGAAGLAALSRRQPGGPGVAGRALRCR